MLPATYFIKYVSSSNANYSNALHVWLNKYGKAIYVEDGSWFAVSELTTTDLRDNLLAIISAEDQLLVFDVGPAWSAWGLDDKITKWMRDNWHRGLPTVG